MKIIEKQIDELKPYKNNPRKNDQAVDAVAASIRAFGFKVPIVIDGDGVIVCGHTRLKAAKRLKMKSVPCVVADDLTEEQIKAFRLADNKVSELAEWDLPALDLELADIDFDMSEFGFAPEISFLDFDGEGDGGGSQIQNGDKVRVVIGALMFDIEDPTHEIYDATRNINKETAAAWLSQALLNGGIQ